MNNIESQNRGIDDRIFQEIVAKIKTSAALKSMGITLAYLGQGTCGLKMKVSPEYMNTVGVQHGGITSAMADTAMGFAVQTLGVIGFTLELHINYCAPVFLGTELTAEGNIVHAGKTTVVAEATVIDHNGKLVAKAGGTFYIKRSSDEQKAILHHIDCLPASSTLP